MTETSKIFEGRFYFVLGLGRNGLPVAKRLAEFGATVWAWDDDAHAREIAALDGVQLVDPARDFGVMDALILSPGIPHRFPAPHALAARMTAQGVPILCDAELLYEAVRLSGSRAKFIGITGTNGKSTTTALVAHMLAASGVPVAAGGNLGTPALALPLLGDDGVYVLEMSSYMLERLATMRFDAAAVLNISPDHLERHGGMDGYVAAKRKIFDRRLGRATMVIGVDDPWGAAMAADFTPTQKLSWFREGDEFASVQYIDVPQGRWAHVTDPSERRKWATTFEMKDAPNLPGTHNGLNAAAALALTVRFLRWPEGLKAAKSIATFPGLSHRQQRVAETDGKFWINDSKATNAESTARALECYERVTWIAGGIAKAGGIEALAPLFPRVAKALLIGRDAPLLAETLRAHGIPHENIGTLDAAVRAANALDAPVVLFSPACASFDQFANFEARGEKFIELVKALA